jgi:hypothetical protein
MINLGTGMHDDAHGMIFSMFNQDVRNCLARSRRGWSKKLSTEEMEIAPRDKRVKFGLSAFPRGSKIGNDNNRSFRLAPGSWIMAPMHATFPLDATLDRMVRIGTISFRWFRSLNLAREIWRDELTSQHEHIQTR